MTKIVWDIYTKATSHTEDGRAFKDHLIYSEDLSTQELQDELHKLTGRRFGADTLAKRAMDGKGLRGPESDIYGTFYVARRVVKEESFDTTPFQLGKNNLLQGRG